MVEDDERAGAGASLCIYMRISVHGGEEPLIPNDCGGVSTVERHVVMVTGIGSPVWLQNAPRKLSS